MTLHPSVAAVRVPVRAVLSDLDPGDAVAVACSGGADSLALAAATVFEGHKLGLRVIGVTVDHSLQPGSAEQADRVVTQLATIGVDETVTARIQVDTSSGSGPEAAAREGRYAVLEEVADRFSVRRVLLGHTLDDQAETVLLGLGRGSGPRSLAGMAARDGRWRRPFLGLRRSDTEAVCRAHDLVWWTDPHNADPAYRRARLRHEVLPLLDDVLGSGVPEALARTADQLRHDTTLLDELAGQVEDAADVATLVALPPALRSRVLRRLALEAGAVPGELGSVHLAALDRLVTDWHGQDRVELPGHVALTRTAGRLHRIGGGP